MAKYKGSYLDTLGHFGTHSFHETKNYTMGEVERLSLMRINMSIEQKSYERRERTEHSFSVDLWTNIHGLIWDPPICQVN